MTPPIIQRPQGQERVRRTAYGAVTAVAWGLYFYLWLPLVTLVAWALGARGAYSELYLRQHHVDPFLLLSLPVLAVVCAVLMIAWAEYNRARFSERDRRSVPGDVSVDDVGLAMGADPAFAESLRGRRVATVALDEQGRPGHRPVPAGTTASR